MLQGVDHVFETDLLRPLLEVAESLSGRRYGGTTSGTMSPSR